MDTWKYLEDWNVHFKIKIFATVYKEHEEATSLRRELIFTELIKQCIISKLQYIDKKLIVVQTLVLVLA